MPHTFVGSDGNTWEVFEVERTANPKAVREPLGDGWLCFQSAGKRIRLGKGRYPDDWASLSASDLEGLMRLGLDSPFGIDLFERMMNERLQR